MCLLNKFNLKRRVTDAYINEWWLEYQLWSVVKKNNAVLLNVFTYHFDNNHSLTHILLYMWVENLTIRNVTKWNVDVSYDKKKSSDTYMKFRNVGLHVQVNKKNICRKKE